MAAPGWIELFIVRPEAVRLECSRDSRGHFNLIHHETGMKADLYLAARDDLHRWGRGLEDVWRRVTESG